MDELKEYFGYNRLGQGARTMIDRVYIDNFRTFVNCEIEFAPVSLLLGQTSTGKSTIFDLLQNIKRFVAGEPDTSKLFPSSTLTRWQTLDVQTFHIDLRDGSGVYSYRLALKHAVGLRICHVLSEELTLNGKPLFVFKEGQAQLFDDQSQPGQRFPYHMNLSGLAAIPARHDNTLLTCFRERLRRVVFLRPCPPIMRALSEEEWEELRSSGSNFTSWYRFIQRRDFASQVALMKELRESIDGLESLRLEGSADAPVTLQALIRPDGAEMPIAYRFDELSDGQRQLIVLYSLLFGVSDDKRILFLDEPDNYLSPREVEPWLTAVIDAPGRSVAQTILISHHPAVIDHLARENGIWLMRDAGGPTRVEVGRAEDIAPLRPSELEGRGW